MSMDMEYFKNTSTDAPIITEHQRYTGSGKEYMDPGTTQKDERKKEEGGGELAGKAPGGGGAETGEIHALGIGLGEKGASEVVRE